MKIRRKSSQRENIYEIILSDKSHPTAISIYEKIKRTMPTASLGNLYRNLNILVEEGRIIKRKFADDTEHYDAITDIHYHFICEICNTVSDFSMPVQPSITKNAQKISEHIISSHTIQFYGICEKCKKKNKNR